MFNPSIIEVLNWADFKQICITQKQLVLQWTQDSGKYDVYAFDAGMWHIVVVKGTAEALDFETNFKDFANARGYLLIRQVDADGSPQGSASNPFLVDITSLPHLDADSITGAKGVGIMGSDGTVLRWLKIDATGALAVQTQPSPNVYFIVGQITSASTTLKTVEKTTYTEQTADGQRSIASASANDTAAGTGARTVKITYFNSTGSGPYEETLTLNGTTGVNTAATNICFIEKMEVLEVGSTLSNVGIISLYTAINKGGTVFGSIAATDNQTFWAHHYVPAGKTMKVTGISVSHNGTVVGSGAAFILRSKLINVANVPEIQISDFVRLYGQSSTISRLYNSPVKVTGPARVTMYVTPESGSSIVYRGAVDFFEE